MAGKRYTLVLNFGYVESQRLAYMPWISTLTFNNAKYALIDLANFLKEQFLINNGSETEPKKCCVTTRAKDPEAKFCTKCGRNLQEKEFDPENFQDWVKQLDTDIDTFHGFIDWNPENRWQCTEGLEGAPNQRFVYQAEWVLSAALGFPKDKTITFEDICKDRTKSKSNGFSYY